MNTQAHILLAAALLCRSSNAGPNLPSLNSQAQAKSWRCNTGVILGALIPDISLYLMYAQARIRGINDEVIWGELYYSTFWQNIGAITNSVPVYIALAIVGYVLLVRAKAQLGVVLYLFGLAALLHCLTDLPLHVDDGHAHFWPFTLWIYESSVSYWDVNHYANYWQPIEFFIACFCALIIWRKYNYIRVRVAAIAGLLSYPIMFAFWFYVMS